MADRTPHPYIWAVPPELHALHGVNAVYKSQDLLQQQGLEHASLDMLGQRSACAATQGSILGTTAHNTLHY